jgi:hypothetical protein
MVPVFRELASFVRKILQGEENKGVEFTGTVGSVCRDDGDMEKAFHEGSGSEEWKGGERENANYPTLEQPARTVAGEG